MTRVLHVLPSLDEQSGGPLRLVLDLSAAAERQGLESEAVGVGPLRVRDNPMSRERIHAMAGEGTGYAHSPELAGWLERELRRFDGAVIHGAWQYPGRCAEAACRRAGVPYAYFPHGMLERWAVTGQGRLKEWKKRLYWALVERQVCNGARRVLFTTERERRLSLETFGIEPPTEIVRVYGMAAETERVDAPERPELAVEPGVRVALFLSRLHPKKNVPFLLECWKAAGMPGDWRLVVAGSGEPAYERELRALAERLGLGAQVRFTGFVAGRDKRYLLQRAEWFLLPSSQENFGIAVLEAVEEGCAVAISDRVYLAESFRSESAVLPLRAETWTEFLGGRLRDGSARQTAEADRAHLMREYAIEQVAERWAGTWSGAFGVAQTVAAAP